MQDYRHQEKIFSWSMAALFAFIVVVLGAILIYQSTVGPLGENPAPNALLAAFLILFFFIGANFVRLQLNMDSRGIMVSFGFFSHLVPWARVHGAYQDTTSSFWYGGFGIRLGRSRGQWRLVYNLPGYSRVVLQVDGSWHQEFVFATAQPEKVLSLINARLQPEVSRQPPGQRFS